MSNQKPTVGRIVHFYNTSLKGENHFAGCGLNGCGIGPYPALVVQRFDNGPYVNLIVHAWGGDWREGSVSEYSEMNASRYWVWPPKE